MTTEYSIQKMVSDGTLSTIALGIQYLQRNDIYMRVAGEETPQSGAPSGYTWSFLDNTTLKILPVVPNGVEVVVYRRTDVDAMYNIYSQNAQFDEATIDENNQQLLYIAQEYLEQGLPGAGVDTIEFLRDDGVNTYYRIRRTDGSYSDEFYVPSAGSITKTLAREALRRTLAKAGWILVAGSFQAGFTLTGNNDVALDEATGRAFSGASGTYPENTSTAGFVDRSPLATNDTQVNAVLFASLQDAIAYATSTGKKLVVDGDWSVEGDLIFSWFNYDKPWNAEINGTITATGAIRFQGLANAHIRGGTFIAPDIYLQGIRFSSMADMELRGKCYLGKWDGVPAGGSWSLYWNRFESVQFGSILVKTTISGGCSINANEWSTCTFRDNASMGQLWSVDVVSGKTDPAMAGNTFTNCDWSYAPAWNFLYDYGNAFGVSIVGGYLDTGSDWYHPSSALHQRFNVKGLRNPSGSSIGNRPTADDKGTTGSVRRTDIHPVSAKSLLKYPVSVITAGTNFTAFHLLPIPCNGDYSLNIITTVGGGGVVTITNTTAGGSVAFNPQAVGQSNCIFSASKGDVITVTWSTPGLASDIEIAEISVTLGAGVHGAIPTSVHSPWEYDSGVVTIDTTPVVVATIPVGTLSLQLRDVLVTTRVAVAGGGGEMVRLSAAMVSGSSASAVTLTEYSRALVNGVGGTSDDPKPVVITTATVGTSVQIRANVTSGAVSVRCRVGYTLN